MTILKKTFFILFIFTICLSFNFADNKEISKLSGELIIFHAGSLSIPMKEISTAFKKENPNVNIILEAAGSVECARKITELQKPCDIMASADYSVIDKLLIPKYTEWNIKFASNEMAIVYTKKSRRSSEINKDNWYKIMLDNNIQIGRADPNTDPCGYRAALVTKLAEKYYKQNGLSDQILNKNINNIRPKETDLLALLESNTVDYIFLYRSVAVQHNLKFITLPDQINLKNPKFNDLYNSVSISINGSKPGDKIIQKGEPMVYGVTILKNAPNPILAKAFVKFLLSKEKGMTVMLKSGQPSVIPASTKTYNKLPADLKIFAKEK